MAPTTPVSGSVTRPVTGSLPQDLIDAIAAAGFPEGVDTSALFHEATLSSEVPTVGHLLKAEGISPYSALGKSITQAIENVNLAAGRRMTLTSINRSFLSVDSAVIANADRDQLVQAFRKLATDLDAKASAVRATIPARPPVVAGEGTVFDRDSVATAPLARAVPGQPRPVLAEPRAGVQTAASAATTPTGATATGPEGATQAPTPTVAAAVAATPVVRELPEHPVLQGSARWRKWFATGQHAEQTLALMLHERTEKVAADLPGALDRVQAKYAIGESGRETLERTLISLQEGLQPYHYAGLPEGQYGAKTHEAAKALRARLSADRASVDQEVTSPVLRVFLGLDQSVTPSDAEEAPPELPTPLSTPRQTVTDKATSASTPAPAPAPTSAPSAAATPAPAVPAPAPSAKATPAAAVLAPAPSAKATPAAAVPVPAPPAKATPSAAVPASAPSARATSSAAVPASAPSARATSAPAVSVPVSSAKTIQTPAVLVPVSSAKATSAPAASPPVAPVPVDPLPSFKRVAMPGESQAQAAAPSAPKS